MLGTVTTQGFLDGVVAIVLYGVGMALVVTALTVTLAVAQTGMLRVLRSGMRYVEPASAVLVVLSGLYLTWYWFNDIRHNVPESGVTNIQVRVQNWIYTHQALVGWGFGLIVAAAVVFAVLADRAPTSTAVGHPHRRRPPWRRGTDGSRRLRPSADRPTRRRHSWSILGTWPEPRPARRPPRLHARVSPRPGRTYRGTVTSSPRSARRSSSSSAAGEQPTVGVKLPESGEQALLSDAVTPMSYGLGKWGWVTVRIDGPDAPDAGVVEDWIEESFRAIAPKKLIARLDAEYGDAHRVRTHRHRWRRPSARVAPALRPGRQRDARVGDGAVGDATIEVVTELERFVGRVEAGRGIRLPERRDLVGQPFVAEQRPGQREQAEHLAQPKAGDELRRQVHPRVVARVDRARSVRWGTIR